MRGFQTFLDTKKGGSEKIVGLGGGLRNFVFFKTKGRGGSQKIEPLARGGGGGRCSNFKL